MRGRGWEEGEVKKSKCCPDELDHWKASKVQIIAPSEAKQHSQACWFLQLWICGSGVEAYLEGYYDTWLRKARDGHRPFLAVALAFTHQVCDTSSNTVGALYLTPPKDPVHPVHLYTYSTTVLHLSQKCYFVLYSAKEKPLAIAQWCFKLYVWTYFHSSSNNPEVVKKLDFCDLQTQNFWFSSNITRRCWGNAQINTLVLQ